VRVVWSPPWRFADVASGLDAAAQDRAGALRHEADRDRFATGRVLLRAAAAVWMRVAPERVVVTNRCPSCGGTDHGRPYVALQDGTGHPPHVSVAHAGARVVVALTTLGPVGVDVEEDAATLFTGFGDVALAPEERRSLRAVEPHRLGQAHARLWARKEAVLKATGEGLTAAPASLRVSGWTEPPRLLAWPGREELPDAMFLRDLDLGAGYSACLAVLSPDGGAPSLGVARAVEPSSDWAGPLEQALGPPGARPPDL
jgi:4'-phosphopantetheinyl transferase